MRSPAFTAVSIPTQKTRAAPSSRCSRRRTPASSPTCPSVRRTTTAARPAASLRASKAESACPRAESSSVPPWAWISRSHLSPCSCPCSSAAEKDGVPPIHSTPSEKAAIAKRSRGASVRKSNPHARDAETILIPSIEPERSTTKTTSRAAPRNPSRAGGMRERKATDSSGPRCTRSVVRTPLRASRKRSTKSRSSGSSDRASATRIDSGPLLVRVACCEQERPSKVASGESRKSSTSTETATLGSNPGASRGGLRREASGTRSVSRAVPLPAGARSSGSPPMYRGATTSGRRSSASPSSKQGSLSA